jgi:ubiquinone/menaquinone biosynthesis C-methylase UbiE
MGTKSRIATGFRAIDHEDDARRFVAYLDEQGSWDFWRERKRASIEAMKLAPGGAGLDVGCGVGDEVRAIAEAVGPRGRAAGVDFSAALIAEAVARSGDAAGVEFHSCDAHALPFGEGSFDAVRTERTLQHVAEPAAVVAEMARVTRPGGIVLAIEPDWDTLVIDAEPLELTRLFCRAWTGGVRNPNIGRELAGFFHRAQLEEIAVEPVTWLLPSFAVADQQFEISAVAEHAVAAGDVTGADADAWLLDVHAREADREFFAAVTYFCITGRR